MLLLRPKNSVDRVDRTRGSTECQFWRAIIHPTCFLYADNGPKYIRSAAIGRTLIFYITNRTQPKCPQITLVWMQSITQYLTLRFSSPRQTLLPRFIPRSVLLSPVKMPNKIALLEEAEKRVLRDVKTPLKSHMVKIPRKFLETKDIDSLKNKNGKTWDISTISFTNLEKEKPICVLVHGCEFRMCGF